MVIDEITETPEGEKEWDNPKAPEETSDNRDKEQVERQYNEAKRRHDNLTENKDEAKEEEEKNN